MIINLSKINSLKMLIIMIIIIFLFSQNNYNIFAAELSTPEDRVEKSSNLEIDFNSIVSYDSYLNIYRDLTHPEANYTIDILDYKKSDDAVITTENFLEGKENVVKWKQDGGWIEWVVDVEQEGLYSLLMEYYPLDGIGHDIEMQLMINNELPFEGAMRISFFRTWKDLTGILTDNRGNELRPKQVEHPVWNQDYFKDKDGYTNLPYSFYFKKGRNTIKLFLTQESLAISQLKVVNQSLSLKYEDMLEYYTNQGIGKPKNVYERIQGENSSLKSHSVLHPLSDRSCPLTKPYHPNLIRMNTIGGENWRYPGQWISWKVNVPEEGLYKVGIRYRQNSVRGFFTSRNMYVNGEIQHDQMNNIRFNYGINWEFRILGDENPKYIYLDEGDNEIKLEVTLGEIAKTLRVIEESVFALNDMYRQIIMITGVQPDIYRDYFLEKDIPDLIDVFSKVSGALIAESENFEKILGSQGTEAVLLNRISEQLDSFVRDPHTIPSRLQRYKDNISSLAAWSLSIKEQPLEIDYIDIISVDKEFERYSPTFFEKLKHEVLSFIGSFFNDYTNIGNSFEDSETVNVWIGTGRDQAYVLKNIIDDDFISKSGITVNLNLVQGALLQAIMAGQGPDVALSVGRGEPVNLAIRGAIEPLNSYPGFDDLKLEFMDDAFLPYMFQNNYYAIPETQIFFMMFYRKDIFEKLSLTPPDTWDELYEIAPVIQRNNMQVGLPYAQVDAYSLVSAGMGAQTIFPTLLFQKGGSFYDEDKRQTLLEEYNSFEAFREWTNFYTNYGFPLFKDDYSRFRTGEMPLTIVNYQFYNLLNVAAPEIINLWEMMPIPGTERPDETIDRSTGASGSASIIIKTTNKKNEAWEFVKWWSSASIQARFGFETETVLGPAGRYTPANKIAFESIPWNRSVRELLIYQWENVVEIPEIPGGYYTQRNIDNAFRSVVFRFENPREMMNIWNIETNKEIMRKRIEFGLE